VGIELLPGAEAVLRAAVRTVRIGYRETLRIVLASPLEIRQCLVQRLLCLISRGGESRGRVAKAPRLSCRA
jgi:hypothetical protein